MPSFWIAVPGRNGSMKPTISLLLKNTTDLFFLEHKLYGFPQIAVMDFRLRFSAGGKVGFWLLVFTRENRVLLHIWKFLNLKSTTIFDIIVLIILCIIFTTIYIDWFDPAASLDDILDTIFELKKRCTSSRYTIQWCTIHVHIMQTCLFI